MPEDIKLNYELINQDYKKYTEYSELSQGINLLLSNIQIESKLKSIPEYKDYFDHNTGFIEIIEVIPDGTYQHVINCLQIAAELREKGIFRIPGIDTFTVLQALVTHDIGKQQPKLDVGDIINPETCFPNGKIHARRSAKLIANYPSVSKNVISLVKYHHHREDELPKNFPARLLPMLRLVKLIDGLSAGVTRKNALLCFVATGSKITIYEKNRDPVYCGIQEVDLMSGKMMFEHF